VGLLTAPPLHPFGVFNSGIRCFTVTVLSDLPRFTPYLVADGLVVVLVSLSCVLQYWFLWVERVVCVCFIFAGNGWHLIMSVLAVVSFAVYYLNKCRHTYFFFLYLVSFPFAGSLDSVRCVCFFFGFFFLTF
jgi:hypothetical protein